MYRISITSKKKDELPRIIGNIQSNIHAEVQNQIWLSAQAIAEIMKRILMQSGYKLEALTKAINAEIIRDLSGNPRTVNGIEVGIGNIDLFPKDNQGRQYWNAFNDGWLPPGNWGYFTSGSGFSGDKIPPIRGMSGQKWVHTGKGIGPYHINPNKPIQPLKFVQIGKEELRKHLEKEIMKFLKQAE